MIEQTSVVNVCVNLTCAEGLTGAAYVEVFRDLNRDTNLDDLLPVASEYSIKHGHI